MARPDLNLLITLDVLLAEGSVAGAARRLNLSASATSRALARLREVTGDPLLVRAGRGLVPTPRAIELRESVGDLVLQAEAALRPAQSFDPARLERTFVIRSRDGFVANLGPALIERIAREAPGVRLHFVQKLDSDSTGLRNGTVDLETAAAGRIAGPEVRTQALFRDRFIGVTRAGHALSQGAMTVERYAMGSHVLVSRGDLQGYIDNALAALGQRRRIGCIVSGFADALALVRGSDLITAVPERHTGYLRDSLFSFPLPFAAPDVTICMVWHPRQDADPAHRWLRACVREVYGLRR
jgi:DNA-binding transcriptional LysR family regulator